MPQNIGSVRDRVDAAAFAQDIALIATLRRPLISDPVLLAIWRELKAFGKHTLAVQADHSVSRPAPPRTDPIDLKAIERFHIDNDQITRLSMHPQSVARFTAALERSNHGLILAMHRQNHIVASCMTMAQLAAGCRQAVFLFDPPERSEASHTLWRLFDQLAPHVHVFSTAPRDIARAVKLAKDGAILAIAADVITDRSAAVSVPWGTGVRSAMLGPAWIASTSRASLHAVTPVQAGCCGDIPVGEPPAYRQDAASDDLSLYLRTLSLWDILEAQAGPHLEPRRGFPARAVIGHITDGDSLRQCMANFVLAHPPMLEACPTLAAFINRQEHLGCAIAGGDRGT